MNNGFEGRTHGEDEFLTMLQTRLSASADDDVPARHEGTCEWILQNDLYKQWDGDQSERLNFLMIVAGPGSGKSVLAKFILQTLEDRNTETCGNPVLGFFCKNAEGRNSSSSIIRYFLFALLNRRRELFMHITPFLARQSLSDNSLSFQNLWKMFLAILSDPELGTVRFIIDGLDECKSPSQQELLKAIELSFKEKTTKGKILITTRPTAIASDYGTRLGILQINTEDVAGDLSLIVQDEVDKLALSRGYPEEISETVKKKLEGEADGMFLWVDLVLEELRRDELADTRQTIDQILASLPRSLSDFYARNLESLGTAAEKVIQILLAAPWSLRASDMAVFYAQWPNDCSSLEELERCLPLNIGRYSKAICGSFIKVVDNRIGFVHQSASDYLNSQASVTIQQGTPTDLVLNIPEAHRQMLKTCLKYLSLKEIKAEAAIAKLDSLYLKYPFVEYALTCLAMHTVQSQDLDQEIRALLTRFFSLGNPIIVTWIQNVYARMFSSEEIPDQLDPSKSLLGALVFDGVIDVLRNDFADKDDKRNSFLDVLMGQYNINLNETDHLGFTPLGIAVMASSTNAITFFLQRGSRHDTRQLAGQAVMHFVSESSTAQLLHDAGADLNAKDDNENMPLHVSAAYGRKEAVEFLLSHKADLDSPNVLGYSPLYLSMGEGHLAISEQLIVEGADVKRLGKDNRTMMHAAAASRDTSLIDLARQHGLSIHEKDLRGLTPLHISASCSVSTLAHLIQLGADINALDFDGRTPLHIACLSGDESLVRVLLDAGADHLRTDNNKSTPLHHAASVGKDSLVQLLLGLMADPQCETINGTTALSVAVSRGHISVVRLLIEQGFGIEKQDALGLTPLHLASSSGNDEIVSLLIGHGSIVDPTDSKGETPLMFAIDNGHTSTARLLLESGADVNQLSGGNNCLHLAVARLNLELIDLLIQHNVNVNARGPTGATCLHHAAEGVNVTAIESILAAGVDIDAVDNSGYGAMHFAALYGHHKAISKLLEAGANFKGLSKSKRNPLHCAVMSGKIDAVTMLVDLTLEKNAEDENSNTPLMIAEQEGFSDIATLLRNRLGDSSPSLPDDKGLFPKAPRTTLDDTVFSKNEYQNDFKMVLIKKALMQTLAETKLPNDWKEREDFFMKEVQFGEDSMMGSCQYSTVFQTLTAKAGSSSPPDPLKAAIHFYNAFRVYPDARELIKIYERTVSEECLSLFFKILHLDFPYGRRFPRLLQYPKLCHQAKYRTY